MLLGAIVVVLGAFSIWLELLLRSAAIYVAVLFLPLAFAAMVWPAGWRWCRRLIEFLLAIIFAKVFIVAIIDMAAAISAPDIYAWSATNCISPTSRDLGGRANAECKAATRPDARQALNRGGRDVVNAWLTTSKAPRSNALGWVMKR